MQLTDPKTHALTRPVFALALAITIAIGMTIGHAIVGLSAQEPSPLSEVEQLRHRLLLTETALEQALSQMASCRAQLRSVQLTMDEATLTSSIEQTHPGFQFNPKTGELTPKPSKLPPSNPISPPQSSPVPGRGGS